MFETNENNSIMGFQGEYRFLSNFYPSKIEYMGLIFPTVENVYQLAKNHPELISYKMIEKYQTCSPGKAKRMGKEAKLRSDWDDVKDEFMSIFVSLKFSTNENLKKMLLNTGDKLIFEKNTWGDTYWGVVEDKHGRLQGTNKLGKILMRVRKDLKYGQ